MRQYDVVISSDIPNSDKYFTPEQIQAWCKERMAVYKVPEVRIIDALPMTATGKVKKQELNL